MRLRRTFFSSLLLLLLVFETVVQPQPAQAYSVLSHEEVVDLVWKDSIVPLLRHRYPGLTPEGLQEAHAFAYGGSVIQDIGYYPWGNKLFSDLLHYVRTGDFVRALIDDATTADELAFALGAMAHYASDIDGHPAVNRAVGHEYPKLRAKYGDKVTYGEDPTAHIRVEFGFDVAQVARGRYASEDYRNFIGFQVATPLLERAFQETYGFEVKDILTHEDRAINTYRNSVSRLIPEFTRVALVNYQKQLTQSDPSFDRSKFLYRLSRADYERNWGSNYKQPSAGERMLAFIVRILPKVGPLKALAIRPPDPVTEKLYITSINQTVDTYRGLLAEVQEQPKGKALDMPVRDMPDRDLDTGGPTRQGEYILADKTYAALLLRLSGDKKPPVPAALKSNILAFYSDKSAPNFMKRNAKQWAEVQQDLKALRATAPDTPVEPAKTAAGSSSTR